VSHNFDVVHSTNDYLFKQTFTETFYCGIVLTSKCTKIHLPVQLHGHANGAHDTPNFLTGSNVNNDGSEMKGVIDAPHFSLSTNEILERKPTYCDLHHTRGKCPLLSAHYNSP